MTRQPLLIVGPNGDDCYYAGDLDAGIALARRDRFVLEERGESGGFYVLLSDSDNRKDAAEWGSGKTREEAMRYALGAMFGPMDEEYDEEQLAAALQKEES